MDTLGFVVLLCHYQCLCFSFGNDQRLCFEVAYKCIVKLENKILVIDGKYQFNLFDWEIIQIHLKKPLLL